MGGRGAKSARISEGEFGAGTYQPSPEAQREMQQRRRVLTVTSDTTGAPLEREENQGVVVPPMG